MRQDVVRYSSQLGSREFSVDAGWRSTGQVGIAAQQVRTQQVRDSVELEFGNRFRVMQPVSKYHRVAREAFIDMKGCLLNLDVVSVHAIDLGRQVADQPGRQIEMDHFMRALGQPGRFLAGWNDRRHPRSAGPARK